MSWYILLQFFSQPFKNIKTIFGSQSVKKHVGGWIYPLGSFANSWSSLHSNYSTLPFHDLVRMFQHHRNTLCLHLLTLFCSYFFLPGIISLCLLMAPHSSILAWRIPWTEEPGRLQSVGLRRVWHDWATSLSLFISMHWRRKWQPTPVFLPGESQGQRSMVGCCLWGRTESDMTEVTLQQQQQQSRIIVIPLVFLVMFPASLRCLPCLQILFSTFVLFPVISVSQSFIISDLWALILLVITFWTRDHVLYSL